jgi:predicted enzyme related to lactoylglutathione lyase
MPRIVHFEIPTTNPKRSSDFYKKALGWKIKQWGKEQYWMVTTGADSEPGINGGIMPKKDLKSTVNTVGVASVDKALKKILAAGGKVVRPKIAIPTMGWLAYCADPDGNVFGIMEMSADAG